MAKKPWSSLPHSVFYFVTWGLFFAWFPNSVATRHGKRHYACFVGFPIYNNDLLLHRSLPQVCLAETVDDAALDGFDITTTIPQGYTKLPRLYVGSPPLIEQQNTFVSESLRQGAVIPLTEDQSHYVTKVMRIGGKKRKQASKNNNFVRIFDGVAGEWLAEIVVVSDNEDEAGSTRRKRKTSSMTVSARCVQQLRTQMEDINQADKPWILFAPLKKARAKIMMEKCTELGVGRIIPIVTDRTESASTQQCTGQNMEKLAMQLVEASEQCERLDIPYIAHSLTESTSAVTITSDDNTSKQQPWTTKTLLDHWKNEEQSRSLLICRERSALGSMPVLRALEHHDSVAFLIGPEGGWSPEEESLFDEQSQASHRVQSVSLGSLVLRAETAAAAATAACVLYNDMR